MNSKKKIIGTLILSVGIMLSSAAKLLAQPGTDTSVRKTYLMDSGNHEGVADKSHIAYRDAVVATGVSSLRLHFSDYNLGTNSFIKMTSVKDGAQQHLNTKSMADYRSSSAYFNGEAVVVELHVASGDKNIFFQTKEISASGSSGGDVGILALCDDDNRVRVTDPAVGRCYVSTNPDESHCTAWIIQNGCLLTAGHCIGRLANPAFDLIEFNVPSSLSDGTIQHPHPRHQYSIVPGGKGQGSSGGCQDYAFFTCNPNSETGLSPLEAQRAFYRVVNDDFFSTQVRVTGYGYDNTPRGDGYDGENSDNYTLQTDTGAFMGEDKVEDPDHPNLLGTIIKYTADTMGGNSGGPVEKVLQDYSKVAIGIHTWQGCEDPDIGSNHGTGFDNQYLTVALDLAGPDNTVYVDKGHPYIFPNGTIWSPYFTVLGGISNSELGDTICIAAGSYNEPMTIDKQLTLTAAGGNVTIGQ